MGCAIVFCWLNLHPCSEESIVSFQTSSKLYHTSVEINIPIIGQSSVGSPINIPWISHQPHSISRFVSNFVHGYRRNRSHGALNLRHGRHLGGASLSTQRETSRNPGWITGWMYWIYSCSGLSLWRVARTSRILVLISSCEETFDAWP